MSAASFEKTYFEIMRILTVAFALAFLTTGCVQQENQNDVAILMGFLQQEQTAHLTKNVPLFLEMLHDTVCQIKNGKVTYQTKTEMAERIARYFNMVEFIKWEDSHPPVLTLSGDRTLAHILIQKRVELTVKDSVSTLEKTDFAWTELWKKKDGRWKLYTVTSTDRPG